MRRAHSIVIAVVAMLAVVGCDQGARKQATPDPGSGSGSGSGRATSATPLPAGPYVVRYDCFHSDQPFGPGNQVRNQAWDLGAETYTLLAYEYSSEPAAVPSDAAVRAPVVSPLPDDRAARIEAAIVAVLRGGPFKPEYPVPEGTPCTLAISAGGMEVFKLEKAGTEEKDAATALVTALGS